MPKTLSCSGLRALVETDISIGLGVRALQAVIEGVTDYAIFSISPIGIITSWNTGAQRLYGYSERDICGKPVSLLYYQSAILSRFPAADLLKATQSGKSGNDGWNARKDKALSFASGHTMLLTPDGEGRPRGFVKIAHDTTIHNDLAERLKRQAFHDELTALPNRASFTKYSSQSLAEYSGHGEDVRFIVLYLDLDHFKSVNDRLGHAAGDELLGSFARLLERCSRPHDIVARIGGDEFAVLLTNINAMKDAFSFAERIRLALRKPFILAGEETRMTASIGIAAGSSHYLTAHDLLRDADSANVSSKSAWRCTIRAVFHTDPLTYPTRRKRSISKSKALAFTFRPLAAWARSKTRQTSTYACCRLA